MTQITPHNIPIVNEPDVIVNAQTLSNASDKPLILSFDGITAEVTEPDPGFGASFRSSFATAVKIGVNNTTPKILKIVVNPKTAAFLFDPDVFDFLKPS